MNLKIIETSKGRLVLNAEGRFLTLHGELYPGPTFVVYTRMINAWDIPDNLKISEPEKNEILAQLPRLGDNLGIAIEFE